MLPRPGIVKTPDRRLNAQRREPRAPLFLGAGMATVVEVWEPGAGKARGFWNRHQYRPARGVGAGRILQSLLAAGPRHLLQAHPWKFAVRREALSAPSDQDTYEWAYAYGLPSQMIRCLSVLSETGRDDDDSQDYAIQTADDGTQYLLTDQQDAHILYIWRQEDTTRYSPMAIDAVPGCWPPMWPGQ